MDCFDDNIAVELFEGTLPEKLEAEVEQHAARCSSCRQLLAELARSPSLAGVSPTIPAAGDAHIDIDQGDQVGRFSILHRIGHGGMGVVFSAYDPKLDRKVALKLIRSTEDTSVTPEEAQSRLLREAQAIAQQSHPNVISVYDVGTYKSEVYIAMELVEGHTLGTWLRMWQRPWADILDKFRQAGEALAAAHGSGLVHRDFKPDNVLVGDDERVRVMDFGLARSLFYDLPAARPPVDEAFHISVAGVSELNRTLTKTGALLGTPRYMAPEQFFGGEADARSDQFSFCVALYEALYRQHPFEDSTARLLAEDPAVAPLPPPRSKVPKWVHRAIMRGLSREPSARHPSMRALLSALRPPRARRSRTWLAPVAVLTLMALAAVGYAFYQKREKDRADRIASDARRNEAIAQANAAVRELELDNVKKERDELASEREELLNKVSESLDAVEQLARLEELIVEKDQEILELQAKTGRTPTTAARPKPAAPSHGLRLGAVRREMTPRMDEIKSCFVEWRERQPNKNIAVWVRFDIEPTGAVPEVNVLGSTDKVLRLCLSLIISEIGFPASDGHTSIEYRFDTSPTRFDQTSRVVATRPALP